MSNVDTASMQDIIRFVRESCGVHLTEAKAYLVEYRLKPVMSSEGIDTLPMLCGLLRRPEREELRRRVLDAMTTHETLFFRDPPVFAWLRDHLSSLACSRPSRRLRIWCAACSTGQEPYSVAMLLRECIPGLESWDARIVATDVAESTLETARAGHFSTLQINRGLPTRMHLRWFDPDGAGWRVKPEVRSLVDFQRSNLLRETPLGGPFDLVLCRNVLIYFDQQTVAMVLARLRAALAADGVLVLGAGENVLVSPEGFRTAEGSESGIFHAA